MSVQAAYLSPLTPYILHRTPHIINAMAQLLAT